MEKSRLILKVYRNGQYLRPETIQLKLGVLKVEMMEEIIIIMVILIINLEKVPE